MVHASQTFTRRAAFLLHRMECWRTAVMTARVPWGIAYRWQNSATHACRVWKSAVRGHRVVAACHLCPARGAVPAVPSIHSGSRSTPVVGADPWTVAQTPS